jgi:hypothetical protein
MKTSLDILVTIKGVTIADDAHVATIGWLASVLSAGMRMQYIEHDTAARPIKCDETSGIITIGEPV